MFLTETRGWVWTRRCGISPVLVGEDEPAQLEVSQDHAVLVAVRHRGQHLGEQAARLLLAQALPAAQVRVHVAVVTLQEDVDAVGADHHVPQAAEIGVLADAGVGGQPLLVAAQGNHLWGGKRAALAREPQALQRGLSCTVCMCMYCLRRHQ